VLSKVIFVEAAFEQNQKWRRSLQESSWIQFICRYRSVSSIDLQFPTFHRRKIDYFFEDFTFVDGFWKIKFVLLR